MDCNTPGFPVLHHLPELAQTHVHWVGDAIQPFVLCHPSPPAFNLSQRQGLFLWVGSLHQVTKVLELQHQSFQWIFRVDFLSDWLVWSPCCPRDSQESSPKSGLGRQTSAKVSKGVVGRVRSWTAVYSQMRPPLHHRHAEAQWPVRVTHIEAKEPEPLFPWINQPLATGCLLAGSLTLAGQFPAIPGSWWWTGRPGVLWFMGSQKVGHDWATELNWYSNYTAMYGGIWKGS